MWRFVRSAKMPGNVSPAGCSYWRWEADAKMRVIAAVSFPVSGAQRSTPPTSITSWMPASTAWTALSNAFADVVQMSSYR